MAALAASDSSKGFGAWHLTLPACLPVDAVPLTKAKKKGKDWKEGIVQQVRDAVEK